MDINLPDHWIFAGFQLLAPEKHLLNDDISQIDNVRASMTINALERFIQFLR